MSFARFARSPSLPLSLSRSFVIMSQRFLFNDLQATTHVTLS